MITELFNIKFTVSTSEIPEVEFVNSKSGNLDFLKVKSPVSEVETVKS